MQLTQDRVQGRTLALVTAICSAGERWPRTPSERHILHIHVWPTQIGSGGWWLPWQNVIIIDRLYLCRENYRKINWTIFCNTQRYFLQPHCRQKGWEGGVGRRHLMESVIRFTSVHTEKFPAAQLLGIPSPRDHFASVSCLMLLVSVDNGGGAYGRTSIF